MSNDWLKQLVLDGLQGLSVLRLRNYPPDDSIRAMANVWMRVIESRPVTWDHDRDTPRIREAFRKLAETCEYWPAPAHFFSVLPAVIFDRQKLLIAPRGKHTEETKKMVDALVQKMKMNNAGAGG